jgi:hypothetical protein
VRASRRIGEEDACVGFTVMFGDPIYLIPFLCQRWQWSLFLFAASLDAAATDLPGHRRPQSGLH